MAELDAWPVDEHTTLQPGAVFTLSMGQFVVQVLSVRPPAGVSGIEFPPQRLEERTLLLFPLQELPRVSPPATGVLTDANFAEFTGRVATASTVVLPPR
jgi:hypothetical protein